jgi:hypothetical protein
MIETDTDWYLQNSNKSDWCLFFQLNFTQRDVLKHIVQTVSTQHEQFILSNIF